MTNVFQTHFGTGDIVGGKVVIDGVSYSGKSISILNDKVVVDGKIMNQTLGRTVNVVVEGNPESVSTGQGDISVKGSVGGDVSTGQGAITVEGEIRGDVSTGMGDIKAKAIGGHATTGLGNVTIK